jgi:hypothetical protein|tara:strand:- start:8359 stop:8475 length:117 start_codon:yes stop_codon:yes gene_type:complete
LELLAVNATTIGVHLSVGLLLAGGGVLISAKHRSGLNP